MAPKLRAVRSRLPDAIKDLNRGNARAILEKSQPLVPVDTGALKRSGRVEPAPNGASVLVYGGGEIDYAGIVHYKLGVNHPVGQAQYVGQPLRTQNGHQHGRRPQQVHFLLAKIALKLARIEAKVKASAKMIDQAVRRATSQNQTEGI